MMPPAEFRYAADRGMGRAALCLIENDPTPYLPSLIETCVQGHDQDDRVDYLFALIAFARAEAWAEDRLLEGLPTLDYPSQAELYWGVLNRFAMLGFPRSREAVMAYALRDDHGAKLMAAWGVEGLRWLMKSRPEVLAGDENRLALDLTYVAEEISGEEVVVAALGEGIRAAREASYSETGAWERPDAKGLTWESFLAHVQNSTLEREWELARAYGKIATPEDHRRAAEWALTDDARTMGWLVATLFIERKWPLDPALAFPRLDDSRNGYPWRSILSQLNDPRIRDLAFDRLEQAAPDWGFVSVMASSITEADLERLMRILQGVPDVFDWGTHDLYSGLFDIAKQAKPGLLPAFEWGMENSWCAICRKDLATVLESGGLLSDAFRTEAGYDVEPQVRSFADDRRSPVLSARRFWHAAAKGLGRAVLSAMHGPASLYVSEVRWVALFGSPMLDEEIEPRAAYVWRLIELVGAEETVLDALLLALQPDTEDEYARGWHQAVLAEYAKRGNARAQAALPSSEETSEDGRRPRGVVVVNAEELAQRFATEPDYDLRSREARAFGRKASEAELLLWAERVLREEDPDALDAMGEAFFRRPWPLEPELVIERVADPERDRCVWRRMLKAMPNPEVRAFALAKLAEKEPDSDAVGYLLASFQAGDEAAVLEALARAEVESDEETKYFAWEVVNLSYLHGPELFVPHLEWVIEHSSVSRYRHTAIAQLVSVNALSDYHRAEAAYDAEPETRVLVEAE